MSVHKTIFSSQSILTAVAVGVTLLAVNSVFIHLSTENATKVEIVKYKKAMVLNNYNQSIKSNVAHLLLKPNQQTTLTITVKNSGGSDWQGLRKGMSIDACLKLGLVDLGYSWLNSNKNSIEDGRAYFNGVLKPGQSNIFSVTVTAPSQPGNYQLKFTMIQELVAWFDWNGGKPYYIPVTVAI